MRLSLRFLIPLILSLILLAITVSPLINKITSHWFLRDLDTRTNLIASTLQNSIATLLTENSYKKLNELFKNIAQDERIYALGFCDNNENLIVRTTDFLSKNNCSSTSTSEKIYITNRSIFSSKKVFLGKLIAIHDLSFIQKRNADIKRYFVYFFVALGAMISFITTFIAELSWRGMIARIRFLLNGKNMSWSFSQLFSPEVKPLLKDLRVLRKKFELEKKERDEAQINWSAKSLKEILQQDLAGEDVLIVSNREPYIHVYKNDKVEVRFPASGMVTAMEPIMRACSGTWIAHGSGSADHDVVDKNDRIAVPPENPSYQLRRVWLNSEEEKGYYYGFSNEGLWPLCHIAHTRPTFRSTDWAHYVEVNRKFANVVIEESKTEDPVVLVQDYHFALLPKMIKEKLPKATIITFWHIPWPNPEAFGICPWREEILEGLLGSSIMGFHTRFHCNNFIDTVDRFLESRIDKESSRISYGGDLTAVNNYPISIEWPAQKEYKMNFKKNIYEKNSIHSDTLLGIGVDRMDYTKGILERFLAVERLFELRPQWLGKFTFIQIAAPSRSTIQQYKNFSLEVQEEAKRINKRFGKDAYQPISLLLEHHEQAEIFDYFRSAHLCFVSSLHDGMNLVAKEYIASRDDDLGVLLLSQFTGASRELPEALIINPYNIDQCAYALHYALSMPKEEQRERMRSMRSLVQEFNVYRWAGKMLIDASRMRKNYKFKHLRTEL